MADNNCHIQYASCLLIGVPLNGTCTIVEDAPSTVMAGFVEVTGEPNVEEGTDYSATTAGGDRCGPELKGQKVTKWMDMTGQLCLVDWSFLSATTGNPLVLDGDGNTIGYQELVGSSGTPCDPTDDPAMALAIIRKASTGDGGCTTGGNATGATTNVLHVFPNVRNWTWTDSGWKNERNIRSFTAEGYSNPNIGAGPFNLWPATAVPNKVDPKAAHSEVFIESAGIPVPSCNPVEHPAPAVRA